MGSSQRYDVVNVIGLTQNLRHGVGKGIHSLYLDPNVPELDARFLSVSRGLDGSVLFRMLLRIGPLSFSYGLLAFPFLVSLGYSQAVLPLCVIAGKRFGAR